MVLQLIQFKPSRHQLLETATKTLGHFAKQQKHLGHLTLNFPIISFYLAKRHDISCLYNFLHKDI